MDPAVAPLAVLMCGGRGTRLDADTEKPLVCVGGEPTVGRVLDALAGSRVQAVHAVVSPHTPETAAYLRDRGLPGAELSVIEGSGEGYVADLDAALEAVGRPAVSVVSDLPLLEPADVDAAVAEACDGDPGDSLAVCVPATLKSDLGVSADTTFDHEGRTVAPTGLNVVGDGPDRVWIRDDPRLAVNVNRPGDLRVARSLVE